MRLEIAGEVSHECGNGNKANRGRCVVPEWHVAMPRRVAKVINDARGRMLQKPAYSVIVMLPSCIRGLPPPKAAFHSASVVMPSSVARSEKSKSACPVVKGWLSGVKGK